MSDVEKRPGYSQRPARQDPRLYQVAVLATLLLYAMLDAVRGARGPPPPSG